jgi:predicted protein tyrosine phosphatase
MAIVVCPLSKVKAIIAQRRPVKVVSLLDPHTTFPETQDPNADHRPKKHLRMKIHDITADEDGFTAPARAHVAEIIGFVAQWDQSAPILIHCYAGISRSTATAYITACTHNPKADEEEIALALRAASATAMPNSRIIALADAELGRNGRMVRAIQAIGAGYPRWPDIDEAEPFEIAARFGRG